MKKVNLLPSKAEKAITNGKYKSGDIVFLLLKITWDGPECYETLSERMEFVCAFWTRGEAEKAMMKLAECEYPGMEFQLRGYEYIGVVNGDPSQSGICYRLIRPWLMTYEDFESALDNM